MTNVSQSSRIVVLVGHCGPDMHMLKSAVSRIIPGAKVEIANDAGSLQQHLSPHAVLLINRVLDGRFTTDSGIELIEQLAGRDERPEMMLISNFPEAQAAAIAAGARPGFGKSQLYDETTAAKLRAAIAANERRIT